MQKAQEKEERAMHHKRVSGMGVSGGGGHALQMSIVSDELYEEEIDVPHTVTEGLGDGGFDDTNAPQPRGPSAGGGAGGGAPAAGAGGGIVAYQT